jgi:hypothetical protein
MPATDLDDLEFAVATSAAQGIDGHRAMEKFGSFLEGIQSRQLGHDGAPTETRLVPDAMPPSHPAIRVAARFS